MLWDSIISGFSILGNWQFWVASLSFSSIFVLLYILLGFGLAKTMENEKTAALGCIGGAILPALLQVVFASMLVVFLIPILMGGDEFMPIAYLGEEWWRIVKAGLLGLGLLLCLTFIPVIGALATKTPGVSIFVIGMVIFHKIAGSTLRHVQELNNMEIDLTPGFWTIIGFIFLVGIIVWGMSFLIVAVLTLTGLISETTMERGALFLGPAIGVIPGLISLAIYISYVFGTLENEILLNNKL